jgi:hypothetical protein
LVRSKLEYASVAWNSVTITDSNKLEHVQRKFFSPLPQKIFSTCGIPLLQYIGKIKFADTAY